MKKLYLFVILGVLCLSCSKEKNNEDKLKDMLGVSHLNNDGGQNIDYSLYNSNGLELLENERNSIKNILSNSILDQVSVYKDYLKNLEKKKVIATSNSEFQKYFEEENSKVFDSLIAKDIRVNIEYFRLLDNLETLNIEYSKKYKIPIDSLNSYYDLPKIVLSDEVYLKVKELNNDEEKRKQLEVQERNEDLAMTGFTAIVGLLPAGGAITNGSISALKNISVGLKLAKRGKSVLGATNSITKMSHQIGTKLYSDKIIGKKLVDVAIKTLSNDNKRFAQGKQVITTAKKMGAIGVAKSGQYAYSQVNYTKRIEDFKNIENKIEGRIGDYSDGILSVHFQNVRDNIKKNQKIIYRYAELKN